MKKDIILAGVGGQGILTIAAVIDRAALNEDLNIKQAEVHGMSQRGGMVQSHLRISDREIHSDLIPKGSADLILSVEPLETLRYISYLAKDGFICSSLNPFRNIINYPDENDIFLELRKYKNSLLVDADKLARENGNPRTANMVMLGAAAKHTGLVTKQLEESIAMIFENKGREIVEMNVNAFRRGMALNSKSGGFY